MTVESVSIPARFNGPPNSANGGYTCGLVAAAIGPSASVRLMRPPPLEVPMTRRREEDGSVRLVHGRATIAEGRAARPEVRVPEPPTLTAAWRAAESYAGRRPECHAFPTCFVCGPRRGADGMRISPGRTGSDGLLACPWIPMAALATGAFVDPLFVWAALDCPSGFACMPPASTTVLATMTARLEAPVHPLRAYVVTAWPLGSVGRKHWAGSAIHQADGRLIAVAETMWITLREGR